MFYARKLLSLKYLYQMARKIAIWWFGLVWFYGTSAIVGYLMPYPILYIYTVLFKTIQFRTITQFTSIWPMDMTLSGVLTPRQGSNGNKRVLCIPQSSRIPGASPSDCLVSYPRHLLAGRSYTSEVMQSVYSAAPADWKSCLLYGFNYYLDCQFFQSFCNVFWKYSKCTSNDWDNCHHHVPCFFYNFLAKCRLIFVFHTNQRFLWDLSKFSNNESYPNVHIPFFSNIWQVTDIKPSLSTHFIIFKSSCLTWHTRPVYISKVPVKDCYLFTVFCLLFLMAYQLSWVI